MKQEIMNLLDAFSDFLTGDFAQEEFVPNADTGAESQDDDLSIRREEKLQTLKREKHMVYRKPEGFEGELVKFFGKPHKREWDEFEKVCKKTIHNLLNDVFTGKREKADLINTFREFSRDSVEIVRGYSCLEKKGGTGKEMYFVDNPKDTFKTKYCFSPVGLKSCYQRRVRGDYSDHVFLDETHLIFPYLWGFLKEKLNEGGNVSSLLKGALYEDFKCSLDFAMKSQHSGKIVIGTGYDYSCDDAKAVFDLIPEGYAAEFISNYPMGTSFEGWAKYSVGENRLYFLLTERSLTVGQAFGECGRGGITSAEYKTLMNILPVLREEDLSNRRYAVYTKTNEECIHTARVFEDLKNHTDKMNLSMKNTQFKNYFGFVEFDHEAKMEDVEKILYQDFKSVVDTFLNGYTDKTLWFRIRKLGRHKAAGLFFPGLWCLCVDINHPQSLMHEWGHFYDYAHEELSRKFEFRAIANRYEELLRGNVAEKKIDFGNSKYDLDYYLTKTEIFARCFEMWLTRVCGVSNNVVAEDKTIGFAYPEDKKLEGLVEDYFNKEFGYKRQLPCVISEAYKIA